MKNTVFLGLLLLLVFALGLNLFAGAGDTEIITKIRLPRVMTALFAGSSLALAGVILQALLKNPLADPYVLGVSGGGSVAALLGMLLGLSGVWVTLGAFAGSFASIALVFMLAYSNIPGFAFRLILSGIIMASLWAAVISFILIISPSPKLPGMLFWLMGDLNRLELPWVLSGALTFTLILVLVFAKEIDLISQGEILARTLGLDPVRVEWLLFVLISLLVAAVVSTAGNIGFVGLVVPHLVRLMGVVEHRGLVIHSAVLGGALLVLADWLSHVLWAPQVLPVGIITTFIGVPLFIFLLRKTGV